MTPYEQLTLMVATTTAGILIFQVWLALRTLVADHERRKKQATLEFVQQIRPVWLEAKHALEEKWGKDPLTSCELDEIDNDFQLLKLVRSLLGLLEHLSVGMNAGVFDKELLYRMSGSQLISIYQWLHTYIARAQKNIPTAYIEFQELVQHFEDKKRLRPSGVGSISNS
jgi:hypothetical protein